MFIAMNRFRVVPGQEAAFETLWKSRDSHLTTLDGFRAFHLLRGPSSDDYTLYSSHTVWASREHFDAWTHSEAFKLAHEDAGDHRSLYAGHPKFEGFESVQEVLPVQTASA